eukprot:7869968-Ditylum_brightwellii.AAC.1
MSAPHLPLPPSTPPTHLHIPHPLECLADTPPVPPDEASNGLPSATLDNELQSICSSLPPPMQRSLLAYYD